jgi:hypothetical protein
MTLAPVGWGQSLAVGDLNGDGVFDVALATLESAIILIGDGESGFEAVRTIPLDRVSFSTGRAIDVADLNGDGALDILLTLGDTERAVLLNLGDATFGYPQTFAEDGVFTRQFAVGDLDSDGDTDVATLDYAGSAEAVTIRLNRCLPPSCQPDLDGDGALTLYDFLTFFNLWEAGSSRADFDGDGSLTIFDFLAFQTEFAAGCP